MQPILLLLMVSFCLGAPTSSGYELNPACKKTHVVQPYETGEDIAKKKGIAYTELKDMNPNYDWSYLKAGTEVCVCVEGTDYTVTPPVPSPPVLISTCTQTYTVKAGDTGDCIATAYKLEIEKLYALNPGCSWEHLVVGQKICVSDNGTVTPVTSPATYVPSTSVASSVSVTVTPVVSPTVTVTSQTTLPTVIPTVTIPTTVIPTVTIPSTVVPTVTIPSTVSPTVTIPGSSSTPTPVTLPPAPSPSVPILILPTVATTTPTTLYTTSTPTVPSGPILLLTTTTTSSAAPSSTVICKQKYVICQGDTGERIAITFGTTITKLTALNPGIVWELLQIGQSICISDDYVLTTVTTLPPPTTTIPATTIPTATFPSSVLIPATSPAQPSTVIPQVTVTASPSVITVSPTRGGPILIATLPGTSTTASPNTCVCTPAPTPVEDCFDFVVTREGNRLKIEVTNTETNKKVVKFMDL